VNDTAIMASADCSKPSQHAYPVGLPARLSTNAETAITCHGAWPWLAWLKP